MSFEKSPRSRGRNGRIALARFVEVEMPQHVAQAVVIELESGGRTLLREPSQVALVAPLLARRLGGADRKVMIDDELVRIREQVRLALIPGNKTGNATDVTDVINDA